MAAGTSKKKVSTTLEFVRHTKRYERFDDASGVENPVIKNFYIKQGVLDFDEEKEDIKVTVEVVKKKG